MNFHLRSNLLHSKAAKGCRPAGHFWSLLMALAIQLGSQTPTLAQSPDQPVTTVPLRFYITAPTVAGLSDAEIRRRLNLYVQDVNTVFAKNTRRRFSFDATSVVAVYPDFHLFPNDSETTPERDIWLMDAIPFPGTGGIAGGGRVELYGITKLFDPENLTAPQDADDYLRYQFANLLHELEHTYQAGGIREYYNDMFITDTSARAPIISVNFFNPIDAYWSARRDFAADPLTLPQYDNPFLGFPKTRAEVLAATQFARVSAAAINGDAPLMPMSSAILTVKLVDKVTGGPITAAGQLVIYNSHPSFTLTAGQTVPFTSGEAIATPYLAATGQRAPLDAHRRLVKAYVPGYVPNGGWHTIYDHYEDLVMDGKPTGDLVVRMSPLTAPGPEIVAVEPPAGTESDPAKPTLLRVAIEASQGVQSVDVRTPGSSFPLAMGNYAETTTDTVFEAAPSVFGAVGDVVPLIVTVTDWAGKSTTATTSFTIVDRSGPDGEIFAAGRTLVHSGETVQLTMQFSDLSGVAGLELFQQTEANNARIVFSQSFAAPYDTQLLEVPWTVPDVFAASHGVIQLTLRLRDPLGNMSDVSVTLGVDNIKPALRLISPKEDTKVYPGDVVNFTVQATDESGIDYVEVFAKGQSLGYNPAAPYSSQVTIPADFRGNTDFTVKAFDNAGNVTRRTVRLKVEERNEDHSGHQ